MIVARYTIRMDRASLLLAGVVVAGLAVVVVALVAMAQPPAAVIESIAKDETGKPVDDAVVYLVAPALPARTPAASTLDQIDKEFVPTVLPVEVGTPVRFPNRDNTKHHVYSFSAPKKFELPLYSGTPASPVVFDKPGIVVIGCNIHD